MGASEEAEEKNGFCRGAPISGEAEASDDLLAGAHLNEEVIPAASQIIKL